MGLNKDLLGDLRRFSELDVSQDIDEEDLAKIRVFL